MVNLLESIERISSSLAIVHIKIMQEEKEKDKYKNKRKK